MPHLIYTNSDQNNYTNINFFYILWFQPSLGYMIIDNTKIIIFLDARYIWNVNKINIEKIKNSFWIPEIIFEELKSKELIKWLKKYLKPTDKITIDESSSIDFFSKLKKNFKNVKTLKTNFEEKRIIKNEDEIKNIKKAINIIDKVFESILELEKTWEIIWKTEKDLRIFIILEIIKNSWEKESFDSIVAFWKNSSIPHHITSDDIIWNWPLLIDIWAKFNGYSSDFTRTIWVWEKDENYTEFKKVYEVVKWAYNEALKNTKSWMIAKELDKVARDFITKNWYWEYFTHSLWHWVWLEIHEHPYINKKSEEILKENMFFTNEPWIYLPNNFWIRLENIVHLSKNKSIVYSEISLDLNK